MFSPETGSVCPVLLTCVIQCYHQLIPLSLLTAQTRATYAPPPGLALLPRDRSFAHAIQPHHTAEYEWRQGVGEGVSTSLNTVKVLQLSVSVVAAVAAMVARTICFPRTFAWPAHRLTLVVDRIPPPLLALQTCHAGRPTSIYTEADRRNTRTLALVSRTQRAKRNPQSPAVKAVVTVLTGRL